MQTIACACSVAHLPPYCVTTLLRHGLCRSFCSKHDFFALTNRLLRKLCFLFRKSLWLPIGCYLVKARCCKLLQCTNSRLKFKYNRRSPVSVNKMICLLRPVLITATVAATSHHARLRDNFGGGTLSSSFSLAQLNERLVVPVEGLDQVKDSVFRYVAHVDGDDLLKYPYPAYVHCKMALEELVPMLTVIHARKIVDLHGLSPGSRCTQKHMLKCIENHSCLRCSSYFTVFSVEENPRKLGSKRVAKYKLSKKLDMAASDPSTEPVTYDFPPEPADANLVNTILSKACKKMKPMNLQEAGCAVCGELKPVRELSRLKGIKNILFVLESPGVTRVERKTSSSSVKGYAGPVLDYTCSQVCEGCRATIRKNKVPRLALANNLWIGEVPEALKSLRYVEKILIAKVRHTCAYVKVASGMRKMKANVVAFESPVPKIYAVLPPPREDIDEVLAILFTGLSKPTPEDFARTLFLVRRNAVINALEWLKLNHADYADIEISNKNMAQYEETMPPVSIEYRPAVTNKVPEGTSVFDCEEEDGTVEGDCAFTVHGLTGEILQTMVPNAVKALALQYLNSNGKMLAIGHSNTLQSMWNNTQLYPQMFPWLFPYGLGGIGASSISDKEHKRHLLMYHDKRFQTDINFPFVAFSHEQMKCSTTQSFLLVDQGRFADVSQRFMNINWSVMDELTEKMKDGEHVTPNTDAEKNCFQLIRDLDAISGKMHGSTTSKKYMRSEIWSLINFLGAPSWYITLSPADIQHPICIYYAGTDQEFKPKIVPYDERMRSVCRNPVAGARFFHFMVETFIEDVLGVKASHRGLYGDTAGYYGTVEQQGRLTLHLHMLLWIKGYLNPQELKEKIMNSDEAWQRRLYEYLESCHSGEFITGSHADVSKKLEEEKAKEGYIDPTQTLPDVPPKECRQDHQGADALHCNDCKDMTSWEEKYKITVDDLLHRSNIHSCSRGINKDGTRKKNKSSGSCMDNKWNTCKARFPRPTFLKTAIDECGTVCMKKLEAWLNTFSPLVTYILRCNTDVTSLSSGTAIKGVVLYVSDYITKSTLKTHTIFDSIRSVFQKNSEMIGGTLPSKEKARRFMTKIANLLSAKVEMGAPMICMYLLGNPDHYKSHEFIPFYWQSFVMEARKAFDLEEEKPSDGAQKLTLVKKRGRVVGLSPVQDYLYRAPELEHVNLYEWIRCYKREKLPKKKTKTDCVQDEAETDNGSQEQPFEDENSSFSSAMYSETELGVPEEIPANAQCRPSTLYRFKQNHPLHDSHGTRFISNNSRRVPNFSGATLPRCDQGDREFYCSTMLTLFKPWRNGRDLKKAPSISWDDEFSMHPFKENELTMMKNFNIRYECLDARDDYRAQLKKGSAQTFVGSWEVADEETDIRLHKEPDAVVFDDVPDNPLNMGPRHVKRLREKEMINNILNSTGWNEPIKVDNWELPRFQPEKDLDSSGWEHEIEKQKQAVQEKKNAHNKGNRTVHPTNENAECLAFERAADTVKIVDKSYLEKSFHADDATQLVDVTVRMFSFFERRAGESFSNNC